MFTPPWPCQLLAQSSCSLSAFTTSLPASWETADCTDLRPTWGPEQEGKLKRNMLFWLSDLGIWATGLFLLALFSPGAGLTLGSSGLCSSSVHGIFTSIQSWPAPEVNAPTPSNFRGSSRTKQELGNSMINPFWKTVGNKTEISPFYLLSL